MASAKKNCSVTFADRKKERNIMNITTDKKSNMLYWDSMEDQCDEFLNNFLTDYALTNITLDEDARIDISKAILETIVSKCKEYGINTDEAFPYVDENY